MARSQKTPRNFPKNSIEEKAKVKSYKSLNEKRIKDGLPVKSKQHKKLIAKYKKEDKEAGIKIKYKKTPLSLHEG